jgi:ribose transport system permease protein
VKYNSTQIRKLLIDRIVIIFLVVFVVVMAFIEESFFTGTNIINIFMEFSIYGVVACAMTFAIICGEFDLSASSIFAFSSLLFIDMVNKTGVLTAIIITLICGIGFGFLNGILVSKAKIHAFVVTLGMMISVKGLALFYTDGKPVNTPNDFVYNLGNGELFGIPYLSIVFVMMLIISYIMLKYTRFGRNLYATGGNYVVAQLAGIKVDFYKMMIFVILGFASAFGGVMIGSRMVAGNALYGGDLSLSTIAAVVIGGTSLSGGSGGVLRTLLGLLVVGVLFNSLMLLGVQAYYQMLAKGVILVVVVAVDAYMNSSGKERA